MTDPDQSSSGARFSKTDVVATPEHAASIRREFSTWLAVRFALDRVKASDIVLAVNEALANAVEAAYADAPEPGVMHVRADFDRASTLLTVTVTDEGTWRPAAAQSANSAHGRGIPLMQALTDRASIEPTDTGTVVRLQWDDITAAAAPHVHDCGSRTT